MMISNSRTLESCSICSDYDLTWTSLNRPWFQSAQPSSKHMATFIPIANTNFTTLSNCSYFHVSGSYLSLSSPYSSGRTSFTFLHIEVSSENKYSCSVAINHLLATVLSICPAFNRLSSDVSGTSYPIQSAFPAIVPLIPSVLGSKKLHSNSI